jgi:hypothetical protein
MGNVASASFHIGLGAGASGAIFGLIGSGLVFEYYLRKVLPDHLKKSRAAWGYTTLAALNLGLGFVIPGIDNTAHMGGMFTGLLLAIVMLKMTSNRLTNHNVKISFMLIVAIISGASYAFSQYLTVDALQTRLYFKAEKSAKSFLDAEDKKEGIGDARSSYFYYTKILESSPDDVLAKFGRGRLLLLAGDRDSGMADLRSIRDINQLRTEIVQLADDLKKMDRYFDANQVRMLLE